MAKIKIESYNLIGTTRQFVKIIPELKLLKPTDERWDLDCYRPDCDKPFCIDIQAVFTPYRSELQNEVTIEFRVCNPAWLKQTARLKGIVVGHHHLIVKKFDLPEIRKYIIAVAHRSYDESWEKVVSRLARIGNIV